MTRHLILMRHAKSDWGSAGQRDHDRPLNARGRASAKALGKWLEARKLLPDEILCSSAKRTQETCGLMGLSTPPTLLKSLYLAEAQEMLAELQGAIGKTVLMIGHNPGIAELAEDLVADPPDHERFNDYPTGATLLARFEIADWADLRPGTAEVEAFVIPRDLI
ncbi:phosphohistidine phosphatase [Roseovarius marisflavi]|uniref:Phosphohistidine phosphatase n=1 Tax=Roseovarius marisflavi TaxID=1054996 RepID=A0A1M6YWF1_9RHOB|nr:histidine phosphatase family protein [Roseovarius marisflavi]SHL22644.1 phosphohistidine phosphatase [Roseovarius marisflavi]